MHMPADGFEPGFVSTILDDALDAAPRGAPARGARVYGISGLQGSGKSTLAAQLAAEAARRGIHCALLSIDDVYLPRAARLRLARDVHPLLATRGPPGTHEVALALEVLDALRAGRGTALPRFDKLADDRLPHADWRRVDDVDLVLFEGWFLGTPAEPDVALATPVNELEHREDPDGRWRRWCNAALARDYPALWRRIDRLLFLQPPGFDIVPEWRWQQEQALAKADPQRRGMDRAAVERFVHHFERVSRQALRNLPAIADVTVALDARRRPLRA